MSTPMIRTPQVAATLQCNFCGVSLSRRLPYTVATSTRAAMEPWRCDERCGGTQIDLTLSIARLPDPIATVRAKHPRAFALPPGALSGGWLIIPSANSSPLPYPIAEGPTEAAAWLAAAERVGA